MVREVPESAELELSEKLVYINRVAKVVKGGKRLRFSALVVVGDGQGRVGAGLGKAQEVPDAIRKAGYYARKNLITVPLKGTTIHHQVKAELGAAVVLLKPAQPGTGVIAAGAVRAVVEMAGIKDILTKSLGCANSFNVVQATLKALSTLRNPQEWVAERRGSREAVREAP